MINIFKKILNKCKHKYKDFPWYMQYAEQANGLYTVSIIEPYVCLLCGKRIDKTLTSKNDLTWNKAKNVISDFQDIYKDHIKSSAVVEDMVNDFQLVDKSFLESYEYSRKITEDIMKSMYEDKTTPSGSDNKDLMELINEIKDNLQTTQKGN